MLRGLFSSVPFCVFLPCLSTSDQAGNPQPIHKQIVNLLTTRKELCYHIEIGSDPSGCSQHGLQSTYIHTDTIHRYIHTNTRSQLFLITHTRATLVTQVRCLQKYTLVLILGIHPVRLESSLESFTKHNSTSKKKMNRLNNHQLYRLKHMHML